MHCISVFELLETLNRKWLCGASRRSTLFYIIINIRSWPKDVRQLSAKMMESLFAQARDIRQIQQTQV
jgi:hypothetical protein